eukprot:scaffold74526_cov66-Cyclotella_meneghiniana.AAC.1
MAMWMANNDSIEKAHRVRDAIGKQLILSSATSDCTSECQKHAERNMSYRILTENQDKDSIT